MVVERVEPNSRVALADALAAGLAGLCSVCVTYPVELVKNSIVTHVDSDGFVAVVRDILRTKGITGFYHGVRCSLLHNFVEKFCYYFAYTKLRTNLPLRPRARDAVSGALAELCHLPLSMPFDTILMRQAAEGTGFMTVIAAVYGERGISGFYRGIAAFLLLQIKPMIQQTLFEGLKRRSCKEGQEDEALTAGKAFALGGFARAVATCIVFPYIRALALVRQRGGYADRNAVVAMHLILRDVFRESGIAGWYSGFAAEVLRSTFSTATLLMVRERVGIVTRRALNV